MTAPIPAKIDIPGASAKTVQSRLPLKISFFILVIIVAFFLSFFYFAGKDKQIISNQARSSTVLPTLQPSITPTPTIIPTPTPLLGPGTYACDPEGVCGVYDKPETHGCPKTFADPHCLRECGDKSIRCPK